MLRKKSSVIVHHAADGSQITYSKTLIKQRTSNELQHFRQEITITDHLLDVPRLEDRYMTDARLGLSRVLAVNRLHRDGPNCLIASETRSNWAILCEFLFGGLSALLWAGCILSGVGHIVAVTTQPDEADNDQLCICIVLLCVVLITGFFGFYQEAANNSIMEKFRNMVPKYATVVREGETEIIDSEELVVGDLVKVQAGDMVPADIRIIQSNGLKVDNSSITGEAELQARSVNSTDKNPLETANLAFYGTNVAEGYGSGIVIKTGDNTLIGHIAGLTSGLEKDEMPIKKEVNHFINIITAIAIAIGTVFFIIALAIGATFFEAFLFLIAIIVSNVPEGLSLTLTAALTLTAKRMAKKKCLVKHLQAIEALGSCSVICSDKTGTLTQNRMTVSHMHYDGVTRDVLTSTISNKSTDGFQKLCLVGMLCNRAEFKPGQDHIPIANRKVLGDASESAILKAMETLVGNVTATRISYPKVCEIPFNSTNKYQISIHVKQLPAGSPQHLLMMKGAPEQILQRCSSYFKNGKVSEMDKEMSASFQRIVLDLGYMGERVLAFADLALPTNNFPEGFAFNADKPNFPLQGLCFVGLMSMIDPPRNSVPDAVLKCRSAGIKVVMVTGDHPITAVAIAKKVNILSPNSLTVYDIAMRTNIPTNQVKPEEVAQCNAAVVTGSELREMSDRNLYDILIRFDEIVFARTSPQQKLKIVEAFQKLGEIVAVTGDGVNDSPALKKADIGVAMGISGSDVSKEAADMIILDDNFSTIVNGIEEGRLIFDNLKKSICNVLTTNTPEIIPFVLYVTISIPQTLSVMAIIIIDVGTDLWPAIALAYEKAEADIMKRLPRNPDQEKLVNAKLLALSYLQIGVLQACAGFACYFVMMACHGFLVDRLIGIRTQWESPYINDLEDSFGQEWTYEERKFLERKGYSTYFLAIVITQVADSFVAKTRRLSLIQQKMSNWVLNFGILFEISLAIVVVYVPGVRETFFFEPVEWYCLMPSLPFVLMIIIYDEMRKYLIRRNPKGWFFRETYY